MPKIDGMFFYGGEADKEFLRIVDRLEECKHLIEYHTCQRCAYYNGCNRLFEGLSGRASLHRLRENDVKYYHQKYMEIGVQL